MPAVIGYTGRRARRSGSARPARAAIGSSSGATHSTALMSRAQAVINNGGSRKAKFTKMMTSKKGMAGMAAGVGVLALTRHSGRAVDRSRGRPTGVYKY